MWSRRARIEPFKAQWFHLLRLPGTVVLNTSYYCV